jgi:hypothetical protein
MSMPKGGFTQQTNRLGGPTANPRYFYFVDARRALFLSGWFESQERFKGIQALWTEQIVSWRRNGLPAPKNVTFERVGEWQVICYEMQTPIAELCDIHVRASWIQAGTWLDLHLSVASRETKAAAKEKLVDLLRSIRVEEEGAHLPQQTPISGTPAEAALVEPASRANPTLGLPLRTEATRGVRLTREAAFALLPEPGMRPQKALFYSRLGAYLTRDGFKIVNPAEAKFLVQVFIEGDTTGLFPSGIPARFSQFDGKDQTSVFMFFVYPSGDPNLTEAASKRDLPAMARGKIWLAVTAAPTLLFRQCEEEIITDTPWPTGKISWSLLRCRPSPHCRPRPASLGQLMRLSRLRPVRQIARRSAICGC